VNDSVENAAPEVPSAATCAEAAAWIARLHGEDRTANVEAGFKRWLAASAAHRAAFEMANEIWVGTEYLPKSVVPASVRGPKAGLVVTLPRALAAGIAVVALGISLYFHDSGLATRVGEQRNLTLQDGTRVSLNTASRIHVRYDRLARRVVLDEGEAYFEVAKHPDWPFVVSAGGRQVVARGTAFLVRSEKQRIAVTLVEGKVIVLPADEAVPPPSANSPAALATPREHSRTSDDFTLSPGQRLTFIKHQLPKVDRPKLDRVTAWQHGQVILDHTALVDAAAEMNRYSDVTLKIEEPAAGHAEVTGIFRVGDSESFARAVAETYHLKVTTQGDQIVLAGVPSMPAVKANNK
jgi:transmembrane sensor